MPEYLSPGVFIEEVPAQLKAIEGVSTSTAGFVGEAMRGPVPGWVPGSDPNSPQLGNQGGFALQPDDAPVPITSLADYRRAFGPLPLNPAPNNYLGHSVRAFFDNGGHRAYIARAVRPHALPAWHRIDVGPIARLTRPFRANGPQNQILFLNSLRGITTTGAGASITITSRDGTRVFGPTNVTAFNTQQGSVVVANPITIDLDPTKVAITITGAHYAAAGGPRFWARSPGAWGGNLRVMVASSDRPPIAPSSDTMPCHLPPTLGTSKASVLPSMWKLAQGRPNAP